MPPSSTLPTVTTAAPGSVTSSSATLYGNVNPNGTATTAWFEWGTSSTLATYSSTTSQSVGSGTNPVIISANLTGLAQNTTYYYRAVGQNSAGTQRDGILNFTTLTSAPGAPTLASPADGATNQATSLTLSWNASSGASTYRVQVSTSSTFTSTVVDDSTVATTSKAVSGLSNNTTYYWRVNAKNSSGTSAWSATWSYVTLTNLPTVTTLAANTITSSSSTLNGSENPNGAATSIWFEWGTSSTLSTFSSTTAQAIGSGTSAVAVSANLSGLSPNTTYYYRAVGQNSAGTQKDGILSFTTLAVLPIVTTTSASSVTSSSSTLNGNVNPNGTATTAWFEWGTSSTLSTFSSTTSQAIGSGTSTVAITANLTNLSPNTTYYYRAAGQNSAGTQKDGILSFTTSAVLPTVTTQAASLVTSNSSTLNGTVNPNGAATSVWFEWGTSSTLSTFSSTTSQAIGSGTSAVAVSANLAGLSPNTIYYYRAAGQNSAGTQKDGILSFTTSANLPTVTTQGASAILSSSGTLNGSVNPNGAATTAWFEWGTSSTLSTYNTTPSQAVGSGTTAVAVFANLTSLNAGATYYFRVAAQNGAGIQRDGILNFTTLKPPSPPALVSPVDGSMDVPTTLTLSWNVSSGASSYRLQTSSDSSFSILATDDSTLTTTSKQVAVPNNVKRYWRVSAQGNGGASPYSNVWDFTTVPPPPAAPILASPANGSSGQPTTVTLNWNSSSGATSYRLQVSSISDFSSLIVDDSTLTSVSRQVNSLAYNTTYYWRVNALNGGGTSAWSTPWSLTTAPAVPSFAVSPASIAYGNVVINASKVDSVVVTNSGTGMLTINSIVSSATQFSVSPTNASVPPGGIQKIYITFVPARKTSYSARIIFTHNAPGTPDTVLVTGKGISPPRATTKNVTTINFGSVGAGTSKNDSFLIYNIGNTDVIITSVTSTNAIFSATPTTGTIAANDSMQFYVTVSPVNELAQDGYIILNYANSLDPDSIYVRTDAVTGIKIVKGGVPTEYAIYQNYPNPFNPTTTIQFDLPEASIVKLSVFNILGQEVAKLIDGELQAGSQSIVWNSNNTAGVSLASGMYFYRINATSTHSGKQFTEVKRMTLIK